MRKIVLVFGGIAGAINIAMFFITASLFNLGSLDEGKGELIGYTTMVIALSMIFFGVKSYRDNQLKGPLTFGKGFTVGILIAAVASLMYAVGWEINLKLFSPNFMEQYAAAMIKKAETTGASVEKIAAVKEKARGMIEFYRNPFLRFGMTFCEIFPVGLLISLITAGLLRRKEASSIKGSSI